MGSERRALAERVEEMARPAAAHLGLEVVDVEVLGTGPRTVVRVLAEGAGGVTVEELARLSEAISRQLDGLDLIPHAYTLEVASPGLDRPLRTQADFERFAGRTVEVWVDPPLEGRRRLRGRLLGLRGAGGAEVVLAVEGRGGPAAVGVPRERIGAARLVIDEEMLKADLARGGRRDE